MYPERRRSCLKVNMVLTRVMWKEAVVKWNKMEPTKSVVKGGYSERIKVVRNKALFRNETSTYATMTMFIHRNKFGS